MTHTSPFLWQNQPSQIKLGRIKSELTKLGLAKVVKLDDGADMVRGGFRVWAAV